jgi:hypothetical protein
MRQATIPTEALLVVSGCVTVLNRLVARYPEDLHLTTIRAGGVTHGLYFDD